MTPGLAPAATLHIRYDDYSAISPSRVDRGLIEVLRRTGACCTYAVIPSVSTGDWHASEATEEARLDAERLAMLRDWLAEGVIDLGLHGWNHQCHSGAHPPTPSEFSGLAIDVQAQRIHRGADLLYNGTGQMPITFVPPWNSYDVTTLEAVRTCGIPSISASLDGPGEALTEILFAPITTELGDLRSAAVAAIEANDSDPIIGLMLHPYDFHESGDARSRYQLLDLERALFELQEQYGVTIEPLRNLAADSTRLTAERYSRNKLRLPEGSLPPFIERRDARPYLMSTDKAAAYNGRRSAAAAAFYSALATAAFVMTLVVLGHPVLPARLATALLIACIAAIALGAARVVNTRTIYFKTAALLSVLVGSMAGALVRI